MWLTCDFNKFNITKIRQELWTAYILCEQRCLRKSCEFIEDLIFALPEDGEEKLINKLDKEHNDFATNFDPKYEHSKACFELHEYDRAAHILRDQMHDNKSRFLYYFSMYKAAEKKRIDLINDVSVNIPKKAMLKFNQLRDSIERSFDKREPDGWLLYVYGLVLYRMKLKKFALTVINKALFLAPSNWSAWHIFSIIVDDRLQMKQIEFPNHIFQIFLYRLFVIENMDLPTTMFQNYPCSKKLTVSFLNKYFKESLLVKSLKARMLSYQSNRYQESIDIFNQIRTNDPYRIDSMEVFSNMLYVKKMRKELAKLAYDMERVDPFTAESNSCIANSFSAREDHTKAIVYFTRALRLNPDHLNSWTMIGHEYLEMKSIEKGLQAYRFSISLFRRDCRAWLGLGNTYETVMNSPNVTNPDYEPCIYYYTQVMKYRPNDPIMYMALRSVFDKMRYKSLAHSCGLKLEELERLSKEKEQDPSLWDE